MDRERRLLTRLERLAEEIGSAGLGSPAVILVDEAIGEAQAAAGHHADPARVAGRPSFACAA